MGCKDTIIILIFNTLREIFVNNFYITIFARIYIIGMTPLAFLGFLEMSLADILDIILLGLIIFVMFKWIKGTSAMSIFIAIVSLFLIRVVVGAFNMRLMTAILDMVLDVGVRWSFFPGCG